MALETELSLADIDYLYEESGDMIEERGEYLCSDPNEGNVKAYHGALTSRMLLGEHVLTEFSRAFEEAGTNQTSSYRFAREADKILKDIADCHHWIRDLEKEYPSLRPQCKI